MFGQLMLAEYRLEEGNRLMKFLPAAIGLVAIVVVTASGGLMYGRLSNRWGSTQLQVDAASRLEQIPQRLGLWQSGASMHLPDYARTELACSGDIVRQYVDAESGTAIGVTLVVGPVGTIAVHSPEICFASQNYRLLGKRQRAKVQDTDGVDHTFWVVDFQSNDLQAQVLRVYYAWSLGGPWSAMDDPRFAFIGNPYLYKIQLATPLASSTPNKAQDPLPPFLRLLLPKAGDGLMRFSASH